MSYELSPKEYDALIQVGAPKRYEYSVKRMADWADVWSLANSDGWVLLGDSSGNEMVPIWPHPQFAELCATEDWVDCEPRMINLEDWRSKWLPGLCRDNRLLSVFPIPGPSGPHGAVVSPDRFRSDLEDQLDLIE
jgi:hypothetical protein